MALHPPQNQTTAIHNRYSFHVIVLYSISIQSLNAVTISHNLRTLVFIS
jgi:hypothetical protein